MIKQTYIGLYKDQACTNKVSEHWDIEPDNNPTFSVPLTYIPYGGQNVSDTWTLFLKCKTGFKTQGLVRIFVHDTLITPESAKTKNRWTIGLNSRLLNTFWGQTLLYTGVVTDTPMPVYIKCRSLGPVAAVINDVHDAIIPDFTVHLMIKAKIVRA